LPQLLANLIDRAFSTLDSCWVATWGAAPGWYVVAPSALALWVAWRVAPMGCGTSSLVFWVALSAIQHSILPPRPLFRTVPRRPSPSVEDALHTSLGRSPRKRPHQGQRAVGPTYSADVSSSVADQAGGRSPRSSSPTPSSFPLRFGHRPERTTDVELFSLTKETVRI